MKKILVVFALFAALIFVVSCGGGSKTGDSTDTGEVVNDEDSDTADSDSPSDTDPNGGESNPGSDDNGDSDDSGNNGSGGNNNNDAGIHLGIIGFNYELHTMDIQLLSNVSNFTNFIDNLQRDINTALFYSADTALDMMKAYNKPPKLEHVALVTFTDGIDNHSTSQEFKPEYDDPEDYGKDVHNRIVKEKILGLPVESYVIGLRTQDEIPDSILPKFETMLKDLASSDSNAFQVSDMNEVKKHFADIADSLIKVSTSINYGVYMPGGYPTGQIRYTFDNANSAESSKLYIEGTYNKKTATLENIVYKGFAKGATSIKAENGPKGTLYFQFDNLRYTDGSTVSEGLSFTLWQQIDGGAWKSETEITSADYPPTVDVDLSSALIMLVLDCTTSLTPDNFRMMREAAKEFVRILGNGGSGNGGDNSGTCGNHVVDVYETCDGDSIECSALSSNYTSGYATCMADCTGYDTNSCSSNGGGTSTLPECSSSTTSFPCKDSSTNYIWSQRYSMQWEAAKDHCTSLNLSNYGGYSIGWHLPTIDELKTLLIWNKANSCKVSETNNCLAWDGCWTCETCTEQGTASTSSNTCSNWGTFYSDGRYSKFGETGYFWSSSILSDDSDYAWYVDFGSGSVSNVYLYYDIDVRCVR